MTGYVGATRVLSFDEAFTSIPAAAVTFRIDKSHDHSLNQIKTGLATDGDMVTALTTLDNLSSTIELDGAVYRFTTNALEQSPAAPTAIQIADAVLTRDVDNIEATAPVDSICWVVLSSRYNARSGTTLTVYQTDGTTPFGTRDLGTTTSATYIVSMNNP